MTNKFVAPARLAFVLVALFAPRFPASGAGPDRSSRRPSLGWYPVRATRGAPMPRPVKYDRSAVERPLVILPFKLEILPVKYNCDVLSRAVQRYFKIIMAGELTGGGWPIDFSSSVRSTKCSSTSHSSCSSSCSYMPDGYDQLSQIRIRVDSPCEGRVFPDQHSVEAYKLETHRWSATIVAPQVWGALRGLETLSQMVFTNASTGCLQLQAATVEDEPRFLHRGVMLDTSRHFLPKRILLQNLDAMAAAKMNIFHWHIVDEEAFPYESLTYPELTRQGAYTNKHVYSQSDVSEIIEEARLRGIRVIPEFDTPAHTAAWRGLPHFLTPCFKDGRFSGILGPTDPTLNSTFEYLGNLTKEWRKLFADSHLHLGGDEVDFACWNSNPRILDFMKNNNISTPKELESLYFQRLVRVAADGGFEAMTWEEPFLNGVQLKKGTIVQVWGDDYDDILSRVTKAGYNAVLSSCWYLNLLNNPFSWDYIGEYYKCDPTSFNGTKEQKDLVLGGEACMWTNYAGSSSALSSTWPLAAVVAERLWSLADVDDLNEMMGRLKEMECRLLHRGVPVRSVTGPGYCDVEMG